ncbi:outer membrane beta-barrel family protein [Rufibacter psychrotolerans]|uniref:outer membrane beta-barrel family protein n=1 Tax=Rufibacter psychrotolerans TaxID=2812556 RepID=UPI001967592A|nr:outer membrane beta-barrel family protein [Rufibacter sp. SYSU D00308]
MKKFYNILLLMAALAFLTQAAFGQTPATLSGLVVDEKGEPLSYGTVALLKAADAALLTGTAVELDGTFKLKTPAPGKYLLRISAMGFATQDLAAFEVTGTGFSRDFGKITLKQDAKVLKEVTVQGLRPTVDLQADKMVVSVEGTAMAAGATAYEVLTKSPGVWVDQDGNIQLNGKEGVRVMIDGKLTYLNGKQLQTMLQGMPAENLKNLEIIANPSAKFDAEGTSGIINLNLKKNTLAGLNGSVYAGYQFNREHGVNGGGNLNLKQGKWSSFANLDLASRPRGREFTMERRFQHEGTVSTLHLAGKEDGRQFSPSLRLGTDYDFSAKHSVGGTLNLSHSQNQNSVITNTTGSKAPHQLNNSTNLDNGRFTNASLNLHYLGKLDTIGSTISADVDVVRIKDTGDGSFRSLTYKSGLLTNDSLLENDNPTSYQIYSAKVDYSRPLPSLKGKLELGAKGSHVRSDNQIDFYEVEGSQRILDPQRTDHFIFDEAIYAGYVNFSTALGSKWTLQAGARAEYTDSKGRSVYTHTTTNRHYLDFFPSVFLQQRISENYTVSYNYSRRINRPRYENLNPFIFLIDANTYAQGNPYLRPQYTNSFQFTQTFRKTYNLIIGYSKSKDTMSEVPTPNTETNEIVFQQQNVESESMNATLVAPVNVTSKWNFNNNVTVAYQNYRTPVKGKVIQNDQVMFMAQTNHNVILPKNFKLEVTGGYQGAGVFNVYQTKPSYWVDLGLKRSFLNDQLDVTLTGTDLLRTRKMRGMSNVDGNTNAIDMYHYQRSVRINVRYRFNKGEKFEMKRRNASLDEVNRAGGN